MQVRFWGTRGSIATPGAGTNKFGGNTSCVELRTSAGDLLILDCGTGARPLGAELMASSPKPLRGSILIGHTHWDHIQGFPFFAPVFAPGNAFAVYAPKDSRGSLHDVLAGQMEFTYFPVELGQLPAAITYHELSEGAHNIGGVKVLAQYLHHPSITLGYRIEADDTAIVYLADHEPFSETLWRTGAEPGRIDSILHHGDRRHAKFMTDADLVIHDAQYTPEEYPSKKNLGHSTYEYAVELASAAGVRRLALTHHDPSHDDAFVAEIERQAQKVATRHGSRVAVFCAHEGYDVGVQPQGVRQPLILEMAPPLLAGAPSSARILVVDDDPDMRFLARKALLQDGHVVFEAANGLEGVRMVGELNPDLVLLDVEMPELDGIGVLKALRSQPQTARLPVLLFTVLGDESHTRIGFDVGATDYLTKPFSMPQLAARVRACLARTSGR